jgi:hypothetical protein
VSNDGAANPIASRPRSLFPGFSQTARRFFTSLEEIPCPPALTAEERVEYAMHVLTPLKGLVSEVRARLGDAIPDIAIEPRVGASLVPVKGSNVESAGCPVDQIRLWDRAHSPEKSPTLYTSFSSAGMEVGTAARGGDPQATARVRRILEAEPHGALAQWIERRSREGWVLHGRPLVGPIARALPEFLEPWMLEKCLRFARFLPWEAWLDRPELTGAITEHFLVAHPLFDVMRGREPDIPQLEAEGGAG